MQCIYTYDLKVTLDELWYSQKLGWQPLSLLALSFEFSCFFSIMIWFSYAFIMLNKKTEL